MTRGETFGRPVKDPQSGRWTVDKKAAGFTATGAVMARWVLQLASSGRRLTIGSRATFADRVTDLLTATSWAPP